MLIYFHMFYEFFWLECVLGQLTGYPGDCTKYIRCEMYTNQLKWIVYSCNKRWDMFTRKFDMYSKTCGFQAVCY